MPVATRPRRVPIKMNGISRSVPSVDSGRFASEILLTHVSMHRVVEGAVRTLCFVQQIVEWWSDFLKATFVTLVTSALSCSVLGKFNFSPAMLQPLMQKKKQKPKPLNIYWSWQIAACSFFSCWAPTTSALLFGWKSILSAQLMPAYLTNTSGYWLFTLM